MTTKSYSVHTSAHYCTTTVLINLPDTLPCEQHLLNNVKCTMTKKYHPHFTTKALHSSVTINLHARLDSRHFNIISYISWKHDNEITNGKKKTAIKTSVTRCSAANINRTLPQSSTALQQSVSLVGVQSLRQQRCHRWQKITYASAVWRSAGTAVTSLVNWSWAICDVKWGNSDVSTGGMPDGNTFGYICISHTPA